MDSTEVLGKTILLVGTLLGSILLIARNFVEICKVLKEIYVTLKPFWAVLLFCGTIVIPNGIFVWYWMYVAATNSSRIMEAQVFILLTVELTSVVSIYTFCWGKWIYPKLRVWLIRQLQTVKSRPNGDKKERIKTPP
jgi:hypothetical protein